jgi:hypothetical protein
MPFTPCHSAAVLPFVRSKYLSATGLIIGTMAPDFEYFFRMDVKGIYGHTVLGIFYFDLPVSIVLAFVFHLIVKKNLIDNLPEFLRARFQELRNTDFVNYVRRHKLDFVISIILGTATHILWDAFTHKNGIFVQIMPGVYNNTTIDFRGAHYPLWYALQHISTIVGGAILGVFILMIKPVGRTYDRPSILYWIILIVIIGVITFIRMQWGTMDNEKMVVFVITLIASFCIGITILGLIPFFRRGSA